ncbi:MAG: ATP-binding protein [Prochlorococcaceae cyanobacterium]
MNDVPEQQSYDEVAPNASAMIESMRAYGYTLATAIADLIDNSIAAGARTIWVEARWAGRGSWLTIADDGVGMSESELRDAMRLGSRNPCLERDPADLGRFGLGLKTASLSQCRRLTVFSRQEGSEVHVRRWDLDHLARAEVVGWQLLRTPHRDTQADVSRIDEQQSGTLVLWEVLDRIVQDADSGNERVRSHFLQVVEEVEQHLAMVFHRYLGGSRPRLWIVLNGNPVEAWDPFLEAHAATQPTPEDHINLPGHTQSITVRGYVLPHKDRLGAEDHRKASGPKGWNAQQGFYLYRNERLIVAGSWLGLGGARPWTQEEHYKLARIRLDIPNSMDQLWHLDVKKAHATPPTQIRDRLKGLAQGVREDARSVFAHRGRYGTRSRKDEVERPWKPGKRGGRVTYRIDRRHPLVKAVLDEAGERRPALEAMLRIIEETVPVQQIWLDAAESPDETAGPFYGAQSREKRSVVAIAYETVRRNFELSHAQTVERLSSWEEFSDDESLAILASLRS